MKLFAPCTALTLLAALAVATPAAAGTTFDAVKARGTLICGVNTALAGFSAPDEKGEWSGLDVDLCRAVAVALFNDPKKVKYVSLSAATRFTALQSGEIDMLTRNTTETMTRDTVNGLNFAPVHFYDGQGFLVAKKLGVKSVKELKGATVCVQSGTTTDQNLADYFRANNIAFKPITFEAQEEVVGAFVAGRCDVFTSDKSQLGAVRATQMKVPDDYVVLPETISKEPFAASVRHGDDQWFDLVKWTVLAMVEAEEQDITSKNVDTKMTSTDPNTQRLLGINGDLGKSLGVDNRWAYNIIKQVGNYGESFDRNLGSGSKMQLERGMNALWTKGGMLYAIPFR